MNCNRCQVSIRLEEGDLGWKIGDEQVCKDCYLKELGDFVEKNPIGRIGMSRTMNCCKCNTDEHVVKEIDWLSNAEEEIEVFYCEQCHEFLGVGNIV